MIEDLSRESLLEFLQEAFDALGTKGPLSAKEFVAIANRLDGLGGPAMLPILMMGVGAEILAERKRQIAKGWDPVHDLTHGDQVLEQAAVGLLLDAQLEAGEAWVNEMVEKHRDRRERLVMAGAFVVAAIQRLDLEARIGRSSKDAP